MVRGCLGYALGIGLRGGPFCLLLHDLVFSALCSTFLHVTYPSPLPYPFGHRHQLSPSIPTYVSWLRYSMAIITLDFLSKTLNA